MRRLPRSGAGRAVAILASTLVLLATWGCTRPSPPRSPAGADDLASPDPAVREVAILRLSSLASPEAAVQLEAHLEGEPSVELRALIVSELAAFSAPSHPRALLLTLDSPDAAVRAAACAYFLLHPDESAREPLKGLALADDDPLVRGLAIRALARHAPAAALPLIVEQVRGGNPVSAREAVEALEAYPLESTEPVLLQAARHASRAIRETAVRGLHRDPSEAATSALLAALGDDAMEVRYAARVGLEERAFIVAPVPARATKEEYGAVSAVYDGWMREGGYAPMAQRFEACMASLLQGWHPDTCTEAEALAVLADATRLWPLWAKAGFAEEAARRIEPSVRSVRDRKLSEPLGSACDRMLGLIADRSPSTSASGGPERIR